MSYFEDSRAHRWMTRVASALADYIQPEDANGPSNKQVDGNVWYATMFLYPNHWEAGCGGALPLPNSPCRKFPLSMLLEQLRDYIVSFIALVVLYYLVWSPYSSALGGVDGAY